MTEGRHLECARLSLREAVAKWRSGDYEDAAACFRLTARYLQGAGAGAATPALRRVK